VHRLEGRGGLSVAGYPVEIAGPLELGGRVPVQGFVKEAQSDVVSYGCLPGPCAARRRACS
jgi:hypothetical protein